MSITLVAHFYDYYPFFNSLYLFSRTLLEPTIVCCRENIIFDVHLHRDNET